MQHVDTDVPVVPYSLSHVQHGRRHSAFLQIIMEDEYLLFTRRQGFYVDAELHVTLILYY